MDINDLRAAVTLLSMLAFVGIAFWAFSKRNKQRFEELGNLPLMQDGSVADVGSEGGQK